MHSLTRRGFTLVELLVALVLLAIISAALYRVLVNNQRLYQAQTQRIDLQQNIRAAETILPAEFRELDAADGDISAMSATSVSIRAMRWLGFTCSPPVLGGLLGGVTVTIRGGAIGQPLFFGSRGPSTATDSVLVYYDGNQAARNDDAWARGRPIALLAQNCPLGGTGLRLTLDMTGGLPPPTPPAVTSNVNGAITNGAPVRGFERVTYQLYRPAGDTSWYIGFQPAGGTMQPLIGPVLSNGLTFSYFDAAGVVTNVPANVARIDFVVRARTAQAVRQAAGSAVRAATVDSVNVSVALRNNRRF
jgi:prepilin-type N-terminal cleavage/methylation domain-containing protein